MPHPLATVVPSACPHPVGTHVYHGVRQRRLWAGLFATGPFWVSAERDLASFFASPSNLLITFEVVEAPLLVHLATTDDPMLPADYRRRDHYGLANAFCDAALPGWYMTESWGHGWTETMLREPHRFLRQVGDPELLDPRRKNTIASPG